jgi:hypothetical protein
MEKREGERRRNPVTGFIEERMKRRVIGEK